MIKNKITVLVAAMALSGFVAACSKSSNENTNVSQISANANVSQTPMEEKPKMKEIRHNTLSYSGRAGEEVSIRVEAQGTTHIVTYTLDGGTRTPLKAGDKIKFNLKNNSGDKTILQINLDFDAAGSYTVVVENVINCIKDTQHTNECAHTRFGPQGTSPDYIFVVE